MARRHGPRHWGSKLVVGLVFGLILTGLILMGRVVHTQLQWKQFQLDLALAISRMQEEGGSLKAVSSEEEARVCAKNAQSLFQMFQIARAGNSSDVSRRDPAVEQLRLEFGTGEVLTISHSAGGNVYLRFELPDGRVRTFRLGRCDFSKMERLTSIAGAAYENAPWEP